MRTLCQVVQEARIVISPAARLGGIVIRLPVRPKSDMPNLIKIPLAKWS
jgi:hypothetical protein